VYKLSVAKVMSCDMCSRNVKAKELTNCYKRRFQMARLPQELLASIFVRFCLMSRTLTGTKMTDIFDAQEFCI